VVWEPAILKTVVSNLVFDGATVAATYRKPFDVLAERPSSENWLPGLDLNQQPCGYKCPFVSERLGLSHHPF